jgi:hypothetical protein
MIVRFNSPQVSEEFYHWCSRCQQWCGHNDEQHECLTGLDALQQRLEKKFSQADVDRMVAPLIAALLISVGRVSATQVEADKSLVLRRYKTGPQEIEKQDEQSSGSSSEGIPLKVARTPEE